MQIKRGYYHLGQIRKLVTTVNTLGEWIFLVTLRENQKPTWSVHDGNLTSIDVSKYWLFVNEDSQAPLNYIEHARRHCDAFVAKFEEVFLTEEERGPAFKIPVEVQKGVTEATWNGEKGLGWESDKIGTVFEETIQLHGGMSPEEMSEMMSVYLTSHLARFNSETHREVLGIAGPYSNTLQDHVAEIISTPKELIIFVPDHTGFGTVYIGNIEAATAYLNWPRHIPFDDPIQRAINTLPRQKGFGRPSKEPAMKPTAQPGIYHLSQIRHLALTKDAADTFFFMVTLRDNATPLENPQVDGQSEGVHCLYVNEHSAARLVFRNHFRNATAISMLEGFQFIREFEQLYLTNEECEIVPHLIFKSKESSKDDMDCYRHILERELSPAWAFCSLDDLNVPANLTKLVTTFVTHQLNEIRSNKRIIATFNQEKGEVLINIQAGICRVFVTDGEGGVVCHATDVLVYVNGITPDYLKYVGGQLPNEHEYLYNSLPWMRSLDGSKIRNATISGALVRRPYHPADQGIIAEFDSASPTVKMMVRRDKVRPESDFNGSYHVQRPSFLDAISPNIHPEVGGYSRFPKDERVIRTGLEGGAVQQVVVRKEDGPEPDPISIPWAVVIKVFRVHLLAALQEKHQMTCDQAIAYLHKYQIREDDDGLLRPLMQTVQPPVNLW